MSDFYRLLLGVHVVLGSLALASFWGAMLAGKGGRLHRRCGRSFAITMAATWGTAALLCVLLLADPLAARPPGPDRDIAEYIRVVRGIGAGLLEVSLVAAALLHFGVRALRRRRGLTAADRRTDLAVAALVTAAGVVMLVIGLDPDLPWFRGRGIGAVIVGALELRALLRVRRTPSAWLVEHLVGMMGAGAIAHAALAVNVARSFTDDVGLMFLPAGPTVILFGVAIGWTARRWRRALDGAPARDGASARGLGAVSPRLSAV